MYLFNFVQDEDQYERQIRLRDQEQLQTIIANEKAKSNNGQYLLLAQSQMELSENEREFQVVNRKLLALCLQEDQLFTETGFEFQQLLRSSEIMELFDAYQSPETILRIMTQSKKTTVIPTTLKATHSAPSGPPLTPSGINAILSSTESQSSEGNVEDVFKTRRQAIRRTVKGENKG